MRYGVGDVTHTLVAGAPCQSNLSVVIDLPGRLPHPSTDSFPFFQAKADMYNNLAVTVMVRKSQNEAFRIPSFVVLYSFSAVCDGFS
jgi:hypothetical protein